MRLLSKAILVFACVIASMPAQAAEYAFTARINEIYSGSLDLQDLPYAVNGSVEGYFSYDVAIAPQFVANITGGSIAQYAKSPAITIGASIDGIDYSTSAFVEVRNNLDGFDGLTVTGFSSKFYLIFSFFDPTRAALSNIRLPSISFPPLASSLRNDPAMPGAYLSFGDMSNGSGFDATVLSVNRISPVPEPSTWLLFGGSFGLIGVAMRRRRATGAVQAQSLA